MIVPAYNEAARIEQTLIELASYRRGCSHSLEIIAVDDGSTDATADVLASCRRHLPDLIIARHTVNAGKGAAVATGMLLATGDHRAFFDADAATPFEALDDLLDAINDRPDVVAIGSLRAPGASVVRRQSMLRSWAGRAGNALIRAAVLPGIGDTQRGCKLFPAAAAELAFGTLETPGWAFDIEVLAKCRRLGYEIVEVPIEWHHVDGGQVRPRAYSETLQDVLRIRQIMRTVEAAEVVTDDAPLQPAPLASHAPA